LSRLFRVVVEVELFVVADSHAEAMLTAVRNVRDEAENRPHIQAEEVEHLDEVPADWRNAYPYGGDGKRTCGAIAAAQEKVEASLVAK
jgi:hypothetical protein